MVPCHSQVPCWPPEPWEPQQPTLCTLYSFTLPPRNWSFRPLPGCALRGRALCLKHSCMGWLLFTIWASLQTASSSGKPSSLLQRDPPCSSGPHGTVCPNLPDHTGLSLLAHPSNGSSSSQKQDHPGSRSVPTDDASPGPGPEGLLCSPGPACSGRPCARQGTQMNKTPPLPWRSSGLGAESAWDRQCQHRGTGVREGSAQGRQITPHPRYLRLCHQPSQGQRPAALSQSQPSCKGKDALHCPSLSTSLTLHFTSPLPSLYASAAPVVHMVL